MLPISIYPFISKLYLCDLVVKITLHYASEKDLSSVLDVERAMKRILDKDPKECNIYIDRRCASAHKTPEYLMEVCKDKCDVRGVILGKQPAASAAIDANTAEPVVTYLIDGKDNPPKIYSSLNVPSGVACMTAPPWPEAMALALLKIAAVRQSELKKPIRAYQEKNSKEVKDTDELYRGLSFDEVVNASTEKKKQEP